jgi:hypothetical protein
MAHAVDLGQGMKGELWIAGFDLSDLLVSYLAASALWGSSCAHTGIYPGWLVWPLSSLWLQPLSLLPVDDQIMDLISHWA